MLRFRFRLSLAALAGLVLAGPTAARATERGTRYGLRDDAQAAINSSILLIRRVLHLGPQDDVVSHAIALSSREATLDLELASGHTRSLTLRGGRVLVDGQAVGSYTPGGGLDRSWRRALAQVASLDTRAVLVALHSWPAASLNMEEAAARAKLIDGLRGLSVRAVTVSAPALAEAKLEAERARGAAIQSGQPISIRLEDLSALDSIGRQLQALDEAGSDVAEAVRTTPVRLGDVSVAAGQRVDGNVVVYKGNASIFGEVTGNVVALFGDVTYHRGSLIGHNAVSLGGRVINDGGVVRGDIKTISRTELASVDADLAVETELKAVRERPAPTALQRVSSDVLNVLAVFVALAMLGFGTVFFGRRYVEVVADTASHAFGRSFVVGLLGQLLLLPTFAMLIVGLIFTLVGILLLPFAVVAFVVAAIVAFVGGYLAVAHAIGETVTRRRMAHGAFVRAPNAYGYLFAGLVGLLGLWAAAALTGWMGPIVIVFRIAAIIVTWIAATVGFGAVLLSRAGLRETFAGRHFGEMSDEYLWATPPATPTAARMNQK
jgi:hypothetical protein